MTAFASCRTWTDAEIAALSPSEIARLNYDEILELINATEPTRTQADSPRITESDVLVRLVYALQQRCRNKLACE